jgi:hypothetical protein
MAVIMVDHAGIILLISQRKRLQQNLQCRIGEFAICANVILMAFCRVIRGASNESAPGPSDEDALVVIRLCFLVRSTSNLSAGPWTGQWAILPCLPTHTQSRPANLNR